METIRVRDQVELPDGTLATVLQVLDTEENGKFYKVQKIETGVELMLDEKKVRLCSEKSLLKSLLGRFRI